MHKSTQHTPERLKIVPASCSEYPLDTSEQVPPDTAQASALKNLQKRARSKFVTNLIASPLSKLSSPLEKSYKLSERCSQEITETSGKLTSLYCGCRWCLVCARMRTARLLQGYMPAIEAMGDKYFVTLSRPNVVAADLEREIHLYIRTAQLIQRHLREKRKLDYSSLRKIECTYNEVANTYHPHFHIIFDDFQAADLFLGEWLQRMPTAQLDKGNQLLPCDNKTALELFKYFTKVVSKTKSTAKLGAVATDYRIHLAALDTMFVAMRGVRTFQPCGVIKAVSEEIETEQTLESGRDEVNFWKWLNHDWVNLDTERALSGYVPAAGIQDISNHIVYPAGVKKAAPVADLTPFYVDKLTGEVVPNEQAQDVRNLARYGKIYPLPEDDKPTRGSVLRPMLPCAYFCGPDSSQCEAAAVLPVSLPAAPVAPQMALFALPAPVKISRVIKKAARPPKSRPDVVFDRLSTDSLHFFHS